MSSQLHRDEGDILTDAILCPQCKRKYGTTNSEREAKLLNCLDTFCLECLQKHVHLGTTNYPWHPVSCQLCQVSIDGDVESVKTNPVVKSLLKIEAVTSDPNSGPRIVCDACAGETPEGETVGQDLPHAEFYCEECDQKLCGSCHSVHGKLSFTKWHTRIVRLGSQESKSLARSWKDLLPRCSSHADQSVAGEFYCGSCLVYVCGVCAEEHAEAHKSPCLPSFQMTQELRTGLAKQAVEMAKLGNEATDKQEAIKRRKKLFADSVSATSREILQRVESSHLAIDLCKDELTTQLERIRVKTEEEFEDELDSARRSELRMNRFVKFTGLMKTVDLSTLVDLLPMVDQRANDLKRTKFVDNGQLVSVCLTSGSWQQIVANGEGNCIGNIDVNRSPQT